jgi:hypothetical protein
MVSQKIYIRQGCLETVCVPDTKDIIREGIILNLLGYPGCIEAASRRRVIETYLAGLNGVIDTL